MMRKNTVNGRRHGQIQFGESLMVVIVLVFLLIIGMVFYYNISSSNLREEFQYQEDIQTIQLAKNVFALPEIKCSNLVGGREACIDELKIVSLGQILQENGPYYDEEIASYYKELFGFANLSLQLVGPSLGGQTVSTGGSSLSFSRQFIFTNLYNPFTAQRQLAYLDVKRYEQEALS